MDNKIRIKDIAKLARVSTGTVDRVLHNRPEVSTETRRRVMAIVEKYGYTPNLLAKSLARKGACKIAAILPDAADNNPYWDLPLQGIKRAAEEIRDYNAHVDIHLFRINNEQSFQQVASEVFETKPEGIVFSPVFPVSAGYLFNRCKEEDIPYVFLDSNLDQKENLAYYGQNTLKSGYLTAKLMCFGLRNNDAIMILKLGRQEGIAHHLDQREKGFRSYFNSCPDRPIRVETIPIDMTRQDEPASTLLERLRTNSDFKGIFVLNSRSYEVARFLEENKLTDLILIGYDLIEENKHHLEKGTIDFLISQKPEEQGYQSIMGLYQYLVYNKIPATINYSPIDIITKENITYYSS